jgi:N-acetylmuramoyl-L-alanine amidase
MAFKIALNAGHYLKTAGKRCSKALDPNETREWVLNDRICDKIEQKLKAYEGYSLLRIDDTTGSTDVSLANRTTKANSWGADFFLSIHHNAGVRGGTGGGVVAYVYTKVDANTKDWQQKLYNAIIAKTGLKGNRSTPLASANLYECRKTKMACVLLECGFMDSKTDVPVILTDVYADKVAEACVEVLVAKGGLKKKVVETQAPVADSTTKIYRVQVGAYKNKANATAMQKKLKDAGFTAVIV